jgi:hypothetical protein
MKRTRPEQVTKESTSKASTTASTDTNTANTDDVAEYLPGVSTGERSNPKQAKKEIQWLKPKSKSQSTPRIGQDYQVSLPTFTPASKE